MFEVATKTLKFEIQHDGGVNSTEFSPDAQLIASACDDRRVRVFKATSGELVREFEPHAGRVWYVSFSDDNRFIVSSCRDGHVWIFDVATGERKDELIHPGPVWASCFSPGTGLLATACQDGLARVYEVDDEGRCSSKPIFEFKHGNPCDEVRHVSFSPCGRILLTSSFDGMARLFNTVTCPKSPTPSARDIRRWRFQPPDGQWRRTLRVAEAGGPRTRHVVQPGETFDVCEERVGRDGIRYLRLTDGKGWCIEGRPGKCNLCVRHRSFPGSCVNTLVCLLIVVLSLLAWCTVNAARPGPMPD